MGFYFKNTMKTRISITLVAASLVIVTCLPPPHPAVINARHTEELLPPHLRSPALSNPHFLETLELTSLLHNGERPVFQRDADRISRKKIYNILTHAGFIDRNHLGNQVHSKHQANVQRHQIHDFPFAFSSDILQYL